MNELESLKSDCPYCGESIELIIDCSETHQNYVEDCQVCCQPIIVTATISGDEYINLTLNRENE